MTQSPLVPRLADPYQPARYPGGAPLDAAGLHVVRRWSYGYTRALAREVVSAGGAGAWFEAQLRPSRITDTAADRTYAWWPSLARRPADLWQRQVSETEFGWRVMADYARWVMMRRMISRRQVLEVMTEFWETLLHVPVNGDHWFTHRVSYGTTVRTHALGTYANLLKACILHPAMGMFLDNAVSTKAKPNENLGRELLELHTVGRGNHTEDDVKDSARILTGYRVDLWRTWAATYTPADHSTGTVRVLGFTHPNTNPDGRAVAEAYLDYLARHPATAQRVCQRLAAKFVSDDPPARLVTRMVRTWQSSGTSIVAVLRTLVASPEFQAARDSKLRDPVEDVLASYRALGVGVAQPRVDDDAALQMLWQSNAIGTMPFSWPRPDGPPIDNRSWGSSSRALASFSMHWSLAGTWWPRSGATYRTPAQWLPRTSLTFAQLVDHLSIQVLGRVSTATLLKACCEVTNYAPSTVINANHPLVKWEFHRLLSTLLDSPAHLSR
ncbi:DUF1800 domain-containing protein [Nocardioides zeae]|uniref:DUF1800 domain-containing protein n=1 Tax=Nocardioides imazamoxiresistens TaxID=3231893 RepID=A0ABU3PU11_9ACTN|nr:DUF1800 domain-containing protein [Nocardioides zeae]MDT9592401.1 DUF1800 domain-containing protein [Nocardioides zeae]